jgi:hypothetical protein
MVRACIGWLPCRVSGDHVGHDEKTETPEAPENISVTSVLLTSYSLLLTPHFSPLTPHFQPIPQRIPN